MAHGVLQPIFFGCPCMHLLRKPADYEFPRLKSNCMVNSQVSEIVMWVYSNQNNPCPQGTLLIAHT